MKKNLIAVFLLIGFLGFSQTTKKKTYKKPFKKTYAKKKTVTKKVPVAKVEPIAVVETPVVVVEEIKPTVVETPVAPEKEDFEITAQKILKKKGYLNNRNSAYVRGIEGFVKGIYSANGKIFILLDLANRTNINYDIESASFITSPNKKGDKSLELEEKTYLPIWSNQPEALTKKQTQKVVYVFDKFTISDKKDLLFVMNEIDGERTLTLNIKSEFIINADYIK